MIGPVYQYRATLNRIIDGDTYVLDVDLGFRITAAITIRLHDFDTPEVVGEQKPRGLAAKAFVERVLVSASEANTIVIVSYKDAMSFARWIADVYIAGQLLREILQSAGHAK